MFDVKKSKKSKTVFPNILKSPNAPKESVAGIAIKDITTNKIVHALILETLNLSINVAHGPSIMLIPDVIAAHNNKTKNENEIIFPY